MAERKTRRLPPGVVVLAGEGGATMKTVEGTESTEVHLSLDELQKDVRKRTERTDALYRRANWLATAAMYVAIGGAAVTAINGFALLVGHGEKPQNGPTPTPGIELGSGVVFAAGLAGRYGARRGQAALELRLDVLKEQRVQIEAKRVAMQGNR